MTINVPVSDIQKDEDVVVRTIFRSVTNLGLAADVRLITSNGLILGSFFYQPGNALTFIKRAIDIRMETLTKINNQSRKPE